MKFYKVLVSIVNDFERGFCFENPFIGSIPICLKPWRSESIIRRFRSASSAETEARRPTRVLPLRCSRRWALRGERRTLAAPALAFGCPQSVLRVWGPGPCWERDRRRSQRARAAWEGSRAPAAPRAPPTQRSAHSAARSSSTCRSRTAARARRASSMCTTSTIRCGCAVRVCATLNANSTLLFQILEFTC